MKKIKVHIKEKGRYVEIPGIAPFRTPAIINVNKSKLTMVIQALHKNAIDDYEITTVNENEIISPVKVEKTPKVEQNDSKINDRLERLEGMLEELIYNSPRQKVNSSEQITNRLGRIERMLKSGQSSSSKTITDSNPVVEEMDDPFIPEINISDMKMKGKSVEVVDKKSNKDVDDAVDLLSSLTKNGGR